MKKAIVLLMCYLCSCSQSPIAVGAAADKNVMNLSRVQNGMSEQEVMIVMKKPYKTKNKTHENITYNIWYYITEGTVLGQTKLISSNFTPLIFQDNKLIGWGHNYYRMLFNIDNAQEKAKEAEAQKYTNDKDEWPSNEHKIIMPKKNKEPQNQPKDKQKECDKPKEDMQSWWE